MEEERKEMNSSELRWKGYYNLEGFYDIIVF